MDIVYNSNSPRWRWGLDTEDYYKYLSTIPTKTCTVLGDVIGTFKGSSYLKLFLIKEEFQLSPYFFDLSIEVILLGTSVGDYIDIWIGNDFKRRFYHPTTSDSLLSNSQCTVLTDSGQSITLSEQLLEIEFSLEDILLFTEDTNNMFVKFVPVFSSPTTTKFFAVRRPNIYEKYATRYCKTHYGPSDNHCLTCPPRGILTGQGDCACSDPNTYLIYKGLFYGCDDCPAGCSTCQKRTPTTFQCKNCRQDFTLSILAGNNEYGCTSASAG
jgi:hypothetical protein